MAKVLKFPIEFKTINGVRTPVKWEEIGITDTPRKSKINQHIKQNVAKDKYGKPKKSYFDLSEKEVYDLIERSIGTGELRKSNNGGLYEIVNTNQFVGYAVQFGTLEATATTYIMIRYSNKYGYHAYPIKEKNV